MSDVPPPYNPDGTKTDSESKKDLASLENLLATKYFGFTSFDAATNLAREAIRQWVADFFDVVDNLQNIIDQIEDNSFAIDSTQGRILTQLLERRDILDEFTSSYVAVIDFGGSNFLGNIDNTGSQHAGYKLLYLIDKVYAPYYNLRVTTQETVDPFNYIEDQIDMMTKDGQVPFTPYYEHLDSYKKIREMFIRGNKFREDTPPAQIAPFQCRIGAATFFTPPTNISVHQAFTSGSLTNGALRASNSPKMNLGHSETEISMTLYFPNHASIWGFAGEKADFDIFNWDPQPIVRSDREEVSGQQQSTGNLVSDAVIDRYLSSLRGLITQFKYAPFQPIKNQYLNRTYGITAVCMQSLTVTTVPDFPFVLAVNLNMTKFNYKPFLPMITDFDQAIHWGKYRQFLGKAAARLDARINQGFLIESPNVNDGETVKNRDDIITVFEGDLLPAFDKVKDIVTGANFDFYYPITTPGKIFAPDTTDFRQPGEDDIVTTDIWDGILSDLGFDLVTAPQFNWFEYDRAYRRVRSERKVLLNWLDFNKFAWQMMSPSKMSEFIDEIIRLGYKDGSINASSEGAKREQLKDEWFYIIYEKFLDDDNGFKSYKESRDFQNSKYTIKEWTVPMEKLYIDWSTCIVNSVAVSLSNNFAKMQIQLQDEPTYQHIGGGDSRISVSMTILGEDNLIRFRRLFEHINGLARIEKIHGVLGFLGIKNVITALCGIKYVLPLDLEVDTVPGFPHVYSVNMSFIDFDIMQQEREKLSTAQQASFIEQFGKKNPFLRLKQSYAAYNAYPDFPLDVRDANGEIIGHLDPDWYFRSFITAQSDEAIFNWGFDETLSDLINTIAKLRMLISEAVDPKDVRAWQASLEEAEKSLRDFVGNGANLPVGWTLKDGQLVPVHDGDENKMPEPELVIRLGLYDKNQVKASFIAFFPGGFMALGWEDIFTGKKHYQTGMSLIEEDLASKNLKNTPHAPDTKTYSEYQNELLNGASHSNYQYEAIMKDYNYRNIRGRMLRAFPTYMLWLIDEGGKFAGIKLFDNVYGLNSVIDFSVVQSQEAIADTLVLRLSNIYNKLTTPYRDQIMTEDDPLFETAVGQWIFRTQNRTRNLQSGMTDTLVELENIRLKPGVRIHLRAGYGCVDDKTEILTDRGWLSQDKVSEGDIALTLNHDTGLSEWAKIEKVNRYSVDQEEMVLIDGRFHSSLTTLNHKWPVLHRSSQRVMINGKKTSRTVGYTREWITSDNLRTDDKLIASALCSELEVEPKWNDEIVELVAWFWTEGHIRNVGINRNPSIKISQSHQHNAENVQRISLALTRLFGPSSDLGCGNRWGQNDIPKWREHKRPYPRTETEFILNSTASKIFLEIAPNKIVSNDFILQLTRSQLGLFIEVSNKADGHNCKAMEPAISISQKDPRMLGALELAAILCGYRTHTYLTTEQLKDRSGNSYYPTRLHISHNNQTIGLTDLRPQRVEYTGIVWCPTTKNQSWLARRNGCVYFTGNSNPGSLQTIFNGVIAEVQPGDIMTVIAQSDAVEFTGFVNTLNTKGHSGKLDGGLSSFWLSEPRDLMVRLLSMGSSNFKEWLAWGSKGVFHSESRFGIRHFGSIIYEEMTDTEVKARKSVQMEAGKAYNERIKNDPTNSLQPVLGDYTKDLSKITSITGLSSAFNGNLIKIGQMLWLNQFSKRDYELFKRNIYPGNGSGIAQFMGGDMIDAGITISTATAWFDQKKSSGSGGEREEVDRGRDSVWYNDIIDEEAQAAAEAIAEARKKEILELWTQYQNNIGITDDELVDFLKESNTSAPDLTIQQNKGQGMLEAIFGTVGDIISIPLDIFDDLHDAAADILPGGGFTASVLEMFVGGPIGTGLRAASTIRIVSGTARLAMNALGNGGLGHILGLTSGISDDDLSGFDEVSFRAQTYMKTVWDLFKVCAALLPNYIVAVRPFEDRSTVFYGKPHWLYTSGLIPITTGIPKDQNKGNLKTEDPDLITPDLLNLARDSSNGEIARMMKLVDEGNALKDITSFAPGKNFDPFSAGGTDNMVLSTPEDLQEFLDQLLTMGFEHADIVVPILSGLDFSMVSYEDLREAITGDGLKLLLLFDDSDIEEYKKKVKEFYQNFIVKKATELAMNQITDPEYDIEDIETKPNGMIREGVQEQIDLLTGGDAAQKEMLLDFYEKDPINFAYHFGWKIDTVQVWFDPTSGFGVDKVGHLARQLWDEGYSPSVDAVHDSRDLDEANDIWNQFRFQFRGREDVKEAFFAHFSLEDQQARFDAVVDLFQRYMWQNPYNRAWVVNVVDRVGDGAGDTANPLGDNSRRWNLDPLVDAWREFLSDTNILINEETGEITSGVTRRFIESNQRAGKDASNFFSGLVEDVSDWVDKNIGQLIGLISDSLTGFIASIRMSMMQMSNAVSEAGDMQRQANIMNASLYDSIYYQWGAEGSLQRLVDNPFTREYGEPVIEVREPFQRTHFISSFDSILDNKITENLTDVATVITATSDGKYPVTVHFDKAISPERQVEKVVETGLIWDNAVGGGLFGFMQPLLHPLETLRSYAKTATGSSDQLSARRVALWHLKQNLQNIYTGEVTIIGNTDIRPFDLIFIADASERMYGMVETQQVIHHFTPETGLITAITPNAIVTINDPQRWAFLTYMWNKFTTYNLRDDVRAMMNINIERSIARGSKELLDTDVYKNFGVQLNGAVQHTQGSTALISDLGAIFTGGGFKALSDKDKALNDVNKVDIAMGLMNAGATLGGALIGTAMSPGTGTIVGGVTGWAVTDLLWEGWKWVKENLLDQHGAYISYLNKDGQPMDAGLSKAQGVSVGSNHSIALFPSVLGLTGRSNYRDEDGHYRITMNDLLANLGYTEVETISLYRETSMFVDRINADILKITGRDVVDVPNENFIVVKARVLDVNGEAISDARHMSGVEDGDTINVRVLESVEGFTAGQIIAVRLNFVNTYELEFHDDDTTSWSETGKNPYNDMGKLAYDYLVARFSNENTRTIAIRMNRRDMMSFNRYLGVVFHNVPLGTPSSKRATVLMDYAKLSPPLPVDSYMEDGRPYTLNWEMVMSGYGAIDMREALWDTSWRNESLNQGGL